MPTTNTDVQEIAEIEAIGQGLFSSLSHAVCALDQWHHERYGGSPRPSHERMVATALVLITRELEEIRQALLQPKALQPETGQG